MAKTEVAKQRASRAGDTGSRKASSRTLDVKQAAAKAMEYFKGLFPGALDISLEEVERSGSEWRITFGYTTGGPLTLPSDIVHSLRGLSEKAYKVVTINANTGEALSVKIRRP